MEQYELTCTQRTDTGKEAMRRLRRQGQIPGVTYRGGNPSVPLNVPRDAFMAALHTEAGENVLISLQVEGGAGAGARTVMIKELQQDPLQGGVLHVDFQEILLTEEIQVNVTIEAKGEAVGVKRDGGMLQHILWEIEVKCLPTEIPDVIFADISELEIGQACHVKDLQIADGVELLKDPETVVFVVEAPKTDEEPTAAEEEGEAGEPEVIRERKPEEGKEGEAAASAPAPESAD